MKQRKKSRFLNFQFKKGNVFTDIMLVVMVFLGMAIVGVVANNMFADLNDDIQNDVTLNNQTKQTSADLKARFPATMDGAFVFAFVLLWLFVIVSSVFVDAHPIFFIVSLILLLFGYGVIMMIGNTYEELVTDIEFSNIGIDFPMTNFIMTNLITITLAMGASVLVVLYGKNRFLS